MNDFRKLLLETMEKHIEYFENADNSVDANSMTESGTFINDDIFCQILLAYCESEGIVDTDKFEVNVDFSFEELRAGHDHYSLEFKGELSEQNIFELESRFNRIVSTLAKIKKEIKSLMTETGLERSDY